MQYTDWSTEDGRAAPNGPGLHNTRFSFSVIIPLNPLRRSKIRTTGQRCGRVIYHQSKGYAHSQHTEKSSKHVLNAQVSIRSPCCRKWFDCAECHAESENHPLMRALEMAFMCKKCKKAFRKDMTQYEDSDEYCPNCDNHYVSLYTSRTREFCLNID